MATRFRHDRRCAQGTPVPERQIGDRQSSADYKAVELGFADDVLQRSYASEGEDLEVSMLYSRAAVTNSLMDKIAAKCHIKAPDNGAATEQTRDIERDLQKGG